MLDSVSVFVGALFGPITGFVYSVGTRVAGHSFYAPLFAKFAAGL